MIANPTEIKGEFIAGYSELFSGQYKYKNPNDITNYITAKSEKNYSLVKLAEKWRVGKEVIDIPGEASGSLYWI